MMAAWTPGVLHPQWFTLYQQITKPGGHWVRACDGAVMFRASVALAYRGAA